MALNIRSEEVNQMAETLAKRLGVSKTEAVRRALRQELGLTDRSVPLWERIRPIQDRIQARGATGLEADKAFYDELSGDT